MERERELRLLAEASDELRDHSEGTIIVRDGERISRAEQGRNEGAVSDVDIGLKCGLTVDRSTVAFVTNP